MHVCPPLKALSCHTRMPHSLADTSGGASDDGGFASEVRHAGGVLSIALRMGVLGLGLGDGAKVRDGGAADWPGLAAGLAAAVAPAAPAGHSSGPRPASTDGSARSPAVGFGCRTRPSRSAREAGEPIEP